MTGSRKPAAAAVLLAGVLLLGAGLRLRGLEFGLPQINCRPDETFLVEAAGRAADGEINPHYFRKPTFFIYQIAAVYRLCFPVLRESPRETVSAAIRERPSSFYLVARGLSSLYGLLTILVVFALGRLVASERAGLVAALFLAVAFLHARDSHFGTVDVPFVFFATAAVLLCCRLAGGGREARPALASLQEAPAASTWTIGMGAAILVGLSASTKYTGFTGLVPLGWAAVASVRHPSGRLEWRKGLRRALLLVAVSIAAFLAGSPFILLDFREFLSTLSFFKLSRDSANFGMGLGPSGFTFHSSWSLPLALGWAIYLLSIGGLVWALARGGARRVVLLVACAAIFLAIGKDRVLFARYALPLVPLLAVFAADFLDRAASLLPSRRLGTTLVALAALLASTEPALRSERTCRLLMTEDTRLAASRWLDANVPAGSRVLAIHRSGWRPKGNGNPQPAAESYDMLDGILASLPGDGPERALPADPARADGGSGAAEGPTAGGGAAGSARERVAARTLEELVARAGADYFVVQTSPLRFYSLDSVTAGRIARMGTLVHSESPWRAGPGSRGPQGGQSVAEANYDQQDAFFLPMRQLGSVARPGPEIRIYRLSSGGRAPSTHGEEP
jgi:hypothetical protein